jgi:hypothetical protein
MEMAIPRSPKYPTVVKLKDINNCVQFSGTKPISLKGLHESEIETQP